MAWANYFRDDPTKMLAVFDFDHTIIDDNSDVIARDLLPLDKIENLKKFSKDWTQYMQQVFNALYDMGITPEEIINSIANAQVNKGFPKLLRSLYNNHFDIIIASDSNSIFIETWLKQNKLDNLIMDIHTNPAKIEDGIIKIKQYTTRTECDNCTKNICKGIILEGYKLKMNQFYKKTLYFGDGKNDFCPVVKLNKDDIVFPRYGYVLYNLLKTKSIQAEIIPWSDMNNIYEYLKTNNLIK
ncbi:pyridoxal phosphate phosphatase PHOSPHO2-like isoform X2 [Daktulosphaira vitifoliae]|uniref:pyridoxal phosphate phosphatase PHOSPHO2-like isoform X2 n=1 Tax=Daktulosphaira vitifoliae TaxID=58002 RepID=UPI0021A9CED9|nr:pyridoxal phosphate phosphatase PHOSPHO2-like isoform X2 [Daktulosphaira vitifoliae]